MKECGDSKNSIEKKNMSDESLAVEGFYGSELFDFMKGIVNDDPELKKKSINKVNSICVITLKNKQGQTHSWVMDFKNHGTIDKVAGAVPKCDIQLFMSDVNFVKLVNNEANPQKLFMGGKLKIKGNIMKAASIEPFLRSVDPRTKAKL